jgi:hypothetical protein
LVLRQEAEACVDKCRGGRFLSVGELISVQNGGMYHLPHAVMYAVTTITPLLHFLFKLGVVKVVLVVVVTFVSESLDNDLLQVSVRVNAVRV